MAARPYREHKNTAKGNGICRRAAGPAPAAPKACCLNNLRATWQHQASCAMLCPHLHSTSACRPRALPHASCICVHNNVGKGRCRFNSAGGGGMPHQAAHMIRGMNTCTGAHKKAWPRASEDNGVGGWEVGAGHALTATAPHMTRSHNFLASSSQHPPGGPTRCQDGAASKPLLDQPHVDGHLHAQPHDGIQQHDHARTKCKLDAPGMCGEGQQRGNKARCASPSA